VPLTPSQSGGLDARIELPSGTRFGAEAYYTGPQSLEVDPYRNEGRPYVTFDFLIGQRLGRVELFVNGEDLSNVRQTNWDPLLLPRWRRVDGGRWTTDVWAPLAGRVVNIGVEVRLGRGAAQ
jgi:outer membrane receptor for ferrienterochelin and colicins